MSRSVDAHSDGSVRDERDIQGADGKNSGRSGDKTSRLCGRQVWRLARLLRTSSSVTITLRWRTLSSGSGSNRTLRPSDRILWNWIRTVPRLANRGPALRNAAAWFSGAIHDNVGHAFDERSRCPD